MEDAKTTIGTAELPTGVKLPSGEVAKTVTFRELAGPEEDILASTSMLVSQKITMVLANCTQSIGDVRDPREIKKLVEKLVITDRWFYIIELRSLSLGSGYQMESNCPKCGNVDKKILDLKELKVSDAPDAADLYREIKLPSGRIVRWKVADGTAEATIEKMVRDDNKATVGLFARVDQIDDKPPTFADVKNMSMNDRSKLRKDIDEKEGELDDKFKATCPGCAHEYEGQVQLDPQSFFYP